MTQQRKYKIIIKIYANKRVSIFKLVKNQLGMTKYFGTDLYQTSDPQQQ